jgi:3-oxoacyl-[acyl-carrier-protein] synthase II
MSSDRRVVITGIGAITPIGLGVDGLWHGLKRRTSAVRCITRFDPTAFKSRVAGEVPDFVATDHIEERRARRLDRYSQFTVAATRMALGDAELDLGREDPDRIGAMMGTALGGVAHGERQYHAVHGRWIPRSRSPCSRARPAATSRSSSAAPAPTPPTG